MPVCEISYARGLLSDAEKDRIVEKVSRLLLEAEGLPDNPVSRSICLVNMLETESMYIGGSRTDKGKIVLKIFVFDEAFSDEGKESLYAKMAGIFMEEHPPTKELNGNNIWCLICPIKGNNFGVGGKPVSLAFTRKIVTSFKP